MVFSLNLIKVIFWFLFWKTLKVVNKSKANNFEGVIKAIDTISVVLLLKNKKIIISIKEFIDTKNRSIKLMLYEDLMVSWGTNYHA